jgi:hypothetical protein
VLNLDFFNVLCRNNLLRLFGHALERGQTCELFRSAI